MKKNRDYLTVITIVLAFLLIASGGIFMWKTMFDSKKEPVVVDPVVTKTTVNVVLKDAKVFRLDELDFQFVIAELEVTSNKALDIGLEKFATSEGIALSNTTFYRDKLVEMGFNLDKYTLVSNFKSDKTSMKGFVFIPIIDKKATTATLTVNLEKPLSIPVNLAVANGTKSEVGLLSTDIITDKTSYKISLDSIVSINGKPMLQTTPSGDSTQVDFSGSSNLFALKVTIEGLGSSTASIEDARFLIDGSTKIAQALGEGYSVEGYPNLIRKPITKATSGFIYLQLNSTSETILKQNGTLQLKLAGQTNWISVFYTK
jgi:hypothetical protein